jgi:two-component system, NarL family, nitrate/nitrite response regulator NarL
MSCNDMHENDLALVAHTASQIPTFLKCGNSFWREGIKHVLADTCFKIHEDDVADAAPLSSGSAAAAILVIVEATRNPDELSGMIRELKARCCAARIVVLVDDCDLTLILQAYEAGATGVLPTTTGVEILVKSLELIVLGELVFPAALILSGANQALHREPADPPGVPEVKMFAPLGDGRGLSTREQEILHLLTQGAPNKVIARHLGVAEATVKVHIKAILRKIRAQNRTQAAMWATTHLSSRSDEKYG